MCSLATRILYSIKKTFSEFENKYYKTLKLEFFQFSNRIRLKQKHSPKRPRPSTQFPKKILNANRSGGPTTSPDFDLRSFDGPKSPV